MNHKIRFLLALIVTTCSWATAQTFKYSITDLGPLSERTAQSAIWAISDNGAMAATIPTQDPYVHAARQNDPARGFEDLSPATPYSHSMGRAINYSGDIAGWANVNGIDLAVVWRASGEMVVVPVPSAPSHANAINDAGQVVGDYATSQGTRAFLWDPAEGLTDLGLLAKTSGCSATSINQYQDVVGMCSNPADTFPNKAFIWNRTTGMRLVLPKFSGTTIAYAINDARQVVGYAQNRTTWNAFSADVAAGRVQYFVLPTTAKTGKYGIAFAINPTGQVVGESNARAFLYDKGSLFDLNSQAPVGSEWVLTMAAHLNAQGQIVGIGMLNGKKHGFLLTPVQ